MLQGSSLYADQLFVKIDEFNITPEASKISDTTISVKLPGELQAGIHGVQVVNTIAMGTPELPHKGSSSNSLAFILSPFITNAAVNNVTGSGGAPRSANIVLKIEPALGEKQKAVLLLSEIVADPSKDPNVYSFLDPVFAIASPFVPVKTITFKVKGVKAGKYLVRLQVDGAESPLTVNASGVYDGPNIVIP